MDRFLKEGCKAPWALRKLMQSKKYGVGELRHMITLNGFEGGAQVGDATEVTQVISLAPDQPDTKPIDPSRAAARVHEYPADQNANVAQFRCYWDDMPGATPPYALVMEQPEGLIFDMKRYLVGDVLHTELYFESNPRAGRVKRIFKKLPPGSSVKE